MDEAGPPPSGGLEVEVSTPEAGQPGADDRSTPQTGSPPEPVASSGPDSRDSRSDSVADQFSAVSAGAAHVCALRVDGIVGCWGDGASGQTEAPDGRFSAVATGWLHSCAIGADGIVSCWGDDSLAQSNPPGGRFDAVAAGGFHTCGLRIDGTISCWGGNTSGQIDVPSGMYVAVDAGESHTCAIRTDSTINCWGAGVASSEVPAGSYRAVTAGTSHSCALRTDGAIDCWGDNEEGQADSPEGQFVAVDAGGAHSCGLRTDGTVHCWGNNELGQSDPPEGGFTAISTGLLNSCGLRSDRTVQCWGFSLDPPDGSLEAISVGGYHSCGLRADGTVVCWGSNQEGQADAPEGRFVAVDAGGTHSCGLRTDETVVCWGGNEEGQADAPEGRFVAVDAGNIHSCGLRTDGTVHCWGGNDRGQSDAPEGGFTAVSAGVLLSCGLRTDGTVECWGSGLFSSVEAGSPDGRFTAISSGWTDGCGLRTDGTIGCWETDGRDVFGTPSGTFSAVSTGVFHSCGLHSDGSLSCWSSAMDSPLLVPAGRFVAIDSGFFYSCGITADRTVSCWILRPDPSALQTEAGAPEDDAGDGDDAEESIRFGFLSGLSGDYSAWGPPSQDGADAAIGEINASGGVLGLDVELVVADNLSTAEGTLLGYERIRQEIHALGGIESVGALALLDLLATDEMPTFCPVCGSPDLDTAAGNYLWRITASDSSFGVVTAQLARDLGYSRVALLVERTSRHEAMADAFVVAWEDKIGGGITADVRFAPGHDNYRIEVDEAFAGDPEAVYVVAGHEAGVWIIRDYISRGGDATILAPPAWAVPEVAEAAAPLPAGRLLAPSVTDDFESPAYAAFAAAHEQYARKPPPTGFLEANQYDQYIALALAMVAAGSTDGPAVAAQVPNVLNAPGTKVYTYADGVAGLERGEDIDYDGASGPLELNRYGNVVVLPMSIVHIIDGTWVEREVIELEAALDRWGSAG